MFSGKRIILGVTGGIAAYKAAFLLRKFQKEGAEIRATLTPAATRFVGVDTFSTLSGTEVPIHIFPEEGTGSDQWTRHISWGEWGDLMVIAPCTANTLSKIVNGQADNMLTATVLAARCPVLICPTMDGGMYENPAIQDNLDRAQKYGYYILEPEEGYLASGLEGKGRLPEIDAITARCSEIMESNKKKDNGYLAGKSVLVTAGPTREYLDPVRFISNPSSGKMGCAMAEAARDAGSKVTLIHGPISAPLPDGVDTISIETADELFERVKDFSDADVVIMAAAVSDFSPAVKQDQKIKKDDSTGSIDLKRNEDILQWLGENKRDGQVLIGFAMETEDLIDNAEKKLKNKKADWIVANSLAEPDSGFESDTNKVHLLGKNSRSQLEGTKQNIARRLLQLIFQAD